MPWENATEIRDAIVQVAEQLEGLQTLAERVDALNTTAERIAAALEQFARQQHAVACIEHGGDYERALRDP